MKMDMDMEDDIDFCISLDKNGRTTFSGGDSSIDYRCKSVLLREFAQHELDDLLLDAEIADCALLPRTFWVGSNSTPRCRLERMALEVFRHHVPENSIYDERISGAEWWVQIRPSSPSGRYHVLGCDEDGVQFHWDKDEEFRIQTQMCIHPHLSTVTYLSDIGAPTLVLDKRADLDGALIQNHGDTCGFLSWPKKRKHLSFDGRYLHSAPAELLPEGKFQEQCHVPVEYANNAHISRRYKRVTFLVNIWINHKPMTVKPFPAGMIDKLSCGKSRSTEIVSEDKSLFHNVVEQKACTMEILENDEIKTLDSMDWNFDCNAFNATSGNQRIRLKLPVKEIQKGHIDGSNISIKWKVYSETDSSASNANKGVDIIFCNGE